MIEIVSRMDIGADGEYDIFSSLFIGSMIEIVSRMNIRVRGEYNNSMVTDVCRDVKIFLSSVCACNGIPILI